ncbi:MAG: glycosyltransferase [Chthoniobacterales bacterium]
MKPVSGHLVVVHYHLRPGGVRRVIEMALPAIVRAGSLRRVTLVVGEGGADDGVAGLRAALEGGAELRVVSHHHDFWFENRWARWEEMRAAGFASLEEVGEVIFSPSLRHAVINGLDARGVDGAVALPNPVGFSRKDAEAPRGELLTRRREDAKGWLTELLGDSSPVWVAATRLLRRKNLAEAVLLHRWLRPEGWLVTTAGVSSAAEEDYARALGDAARDGGWRVRFSVLAEGGGPDVEALVAASEAVVMTSVQEGFGLPYLEAAAAGKPLVARRLPNVMPDLEGWGFRFPRSYDEVWIAAELLDLESEGRRQEMVFGKWRTTLPEAVRWRAEAPVWRVGDRVAFGRLTLAGQLAVLAVEPEVSWAACAELNPGMAGWTDELAPTPWPAGAERALGVEAYAGRFWSACTGAGPPGRSGAQIQEAMISERLRAGYLFPILME